MRLNINLCFSPSGEDEKGGYKRILPNRHGFQTGGQGVVEETFDPVPIHSGTKSFLDSPKADYDFLFLFEDPSGAEGSAVTPPVRTKRVASSRDISTGCTAERGTITV
jgi:hypothetical protein